MPIYEYKCELCGHQVEMLQKISDEPAKTCPECGGDGLRKLVSAAAFKLKGTGWYETDFKDKKTKKDEKATNTNKKESKTDANEGKSNKKNTDTKKPSSSESKKT